MLDCSLYLYASDQAALGGHSAGGSGFLVHIPSSVNPAMGHVYGVTNRHVLDKGFHVVRLNRVGGGFETIVTRREEWTPHPTGLDVEVRPFDVKDRYRWNSISSSKFVNSEIMSVFNIGIGDDAFAVGRLVNHEGTQRNAPIVRFGAIALVADPDEPILTETGLQEAFLVEFRSLSGFSGSPVFLTTTQFYDGEAAQQVTAYRQREMGFVPPTDGPKISTVSISGTHGPWLLGIDCGHIPLWSTVRERDSISKMIDRDRDTNLRVEVNTGVAIVLPAWISWRCSTMSS